jgi:hypothetical protein
MLESQNHTLLDVVRKSATEQVKATRSWMQVLETGLHAAGTASPSAPSSQGPPITQICSIHQSSSASQQGTASSPHVAIDFSTTERCRAILAEKPGVVRRRIDDALNDHDVTKEIKCHGISRNARASNKYKLFFKDEKAVQTVTQNDAWLKHYFQGARLQAEQWHPIRVDSVYRGAVLKEMGGNEVNEEAAGNCMSSSERTLSGSYGTNPVPIKPPCIFLSVIEAKYTPQNAQRNSSLLTWLICARIKSSIWRPYACFNGPKQPTSSGWR